MDYERPTKGTCRNCGKTFKINPLGRVPVFCRPACRVIYFDKNTRAPKLSAADRQRLLTWELLKDAGLIPADKPMPTRRAERG